LVRITWSGVSGAFCDIKLRFFCEAKYLASFEPLKTPTVSLPFKVDTSFIILFNFDGLNFDVLFLIFKIAPFSYRYFSALSTNLIVFS
jgi:hypothetical protein